MKEIIWNFIYLAAFSIAFSGLSGCGGTSNTASNEAPQPAVNAPPETAKEKPPSPNARPLPADATQSELKGVDGSVFKLSDKKGKVLLVNLWATWCGPCRGEMPALVKLQDQYRQQGLEIIGLNADDESADKINKFSEEMKLNYTLVWSDSKFQNSLLNISKFPGIPQSFLIDRDGNLRAVFTGGSAGEIQKLDETTARLVEETD